MELRVLNYFLTVATCESISKAANILHITQPTLSRQIMELESELGVKLFERTSRGLTLTSDGITLKNRAIDIIDLTNKTIEEVKCSQNNFIGEISIGSGETDDIRPILKLIKHLQDQNPQVKLRMISGDKNDIIEKLDKGIYDFGIFLHHIDHTKFDFIELPSSTCLGVLTPNNSKIANNTKITEDELKDLPLIISRQLLYEDQAFYQKLNIKAIYNLAYNASLMVDEGIGHAIIIDKLINTKGTNKVFIPLDVNYQLKLFIGWKKGLTNSKLKEHFINLIKELNK